MVAIKDELWANWPVCACAHACEVENGRMKRREEEEEAGRQQQQ